MRRIPLVQAAVAVVAVAAPGAVAEPDVPEYGTITITDQGFGPRATWTYDGVFDCDLTTDGPGGVAAVVRVECLVRGEGGTGLGFTCPLMVVTRTSVGRAGGAASCERGLDTGVGTGTATASADLGRVTDGIVCTAYVDIGVLVPPYTVTCVEPGLPGLLVPGAE